MKTRKYYALGLATTMTLFFGWLVAVSVQPTHFGLELVRLVIFALALEKLSATLS